jgi:hypothetical protein
VRAGLIGVGRTPPQPEIAATTASTSATAGFATTRGGLICTVLPRGAGLRANMDIGLNPSAHEGTMSAGA